MRVLCLDPSGNFGTKEGFGTTGWALFVDGELQQFGRIASENHKTQESYWAEHKILIINASPHIVVMESYKLQPGKAMQQSWSTLDTPQLIGYLRMFCWEHSIKLEFQDPKDKVRVADPILMHMGILTERNGRCYALDRKTVIHERDAIRHGVFFHRYNPHGKVIKPEGFQS